MMTPKTQTGFRGWHVLGAGFINAMLIAGASLYAFGLFVKPIEAEFGLTREQANLGILALYISIMVWAVLVGRWLSRYSAKTVSIMGGLAFGLGYIIIATASHPLLIVLAVMGPVGFGLTAAGPFLENVLAARWFSQMRGRALGIAAVATSTGGFIIVPLFAALMAQFGWRSATLIMGAIVSVLVVLISWRFIIPRPEDIGQVPDGIKSDPVISAHENKVVSDQKIKVFRDLRFWLLGLGVGLLLGSDQALLASLIPYGQDRGFSAQEAAFVMSVMTGSAIAGKLVVGWLAERWDKRWLFALVCLSNIAFLIAVLLNPSYQQLIIIAAFVGLAIGGVYPVWTTLTAALFGREHFSNVIGAMNLITVPCMLISIIIAGRTFDQTGSYDLAFKIFIPQVIIAALLILALRARQGEHSDRL